MERMLNEDDIINMIFRANTIDEIIDVQNLLIELHLETSFDLKELYVIMINRKISYWIDRTFKGEENADN